MMLRKRILRITVLIFACLECLWLFSFFPVAYATDATISLDKVVKSLDVSIFEQPREKHVIRCFDVNENGVYAVGFKNNTIEVYNSDGTFRYGIHFDTEQYYGIDLNGNNIVIYLARSSIAIEFDCEGNCVSMEEIPLHEDIFAEDRVERKSKQVGNVEYKLERDIGFVQDSNSRLIAIDAGGNRTVLYDATLQGYFSGIFQYLIFFGFIAGVIASIVSKIKSEESNQENS